MTINETFAAIAAIDLNPIKFKLIQQASGEGWSQERADAIAIEYRRFLYLQHVHPGEVSSPTEDVDTFWHYHILDTRKYADDCDKAFGYFMHHYPYLGLLEGDAEDLSVKAAERTRELYEATFGEAYIRAETYGTQAAQAGTMRDLLARCQQCGAARPAEAKTYAARAQNILAAKAAVVEAKPARRQACFTAGPATVETGWRAAGQSPLASRPG